MMIGHRAARLYLEARLPTATLLYGPASVGKWTLARHLADYHHVHAVDRWCIEHNLTVSTSRLVTHFAARAANGPFKLIIARLDDANRAALNALLKTVEEPPPGVRFIFTSTGKPLSTVASRCTVFELGLLTVEELNEIYGRAGVPRAKARRAAEYARGHVDKGYEAESADRHRNQVINLAKALATHDKDLFTATFTAWDGRCTDMLTTLLTESLTHRWTTFTETDTHGLHGDRPRLWRMVSALTRLPAARPRLGVRAALEPFLSR